MARHLEIVKEEGRWKVIRDDKKEKFLRGQDLAWTLHPDPDNPENLVSAHFQFTDADLIENQPKNTELTQDWTASIPEPGKKLHVKVKDLADRRFNPRHYAVWIVDPSLANGGQFAVGEDGNPPPEMDVGGP